MPSGKVHDRITVAAAAVTAPAWWEFSSHYPDPNAPHPVNFVTGAILLGTLLFSGLLLSPDLDLNSSIYERWGPCRFVWLPYQKCIPHRSPLSHSLFLGPILRVLYILVVVWALFRIVTWGIVAFGLVHIDRNGLTRAGSDAFLRFWETHPHYLIAALTGLFIGTALHVIADVFWTGVKRRF